MSRTLTFGRVDYEISTDEAPDFEIEREDESGDVILTIETAELEKVKINIGHFYDSAESLRDALRDVADDLDRSIIAGWEDTPDEYDGWVSEGRDGYYISLEGQGKGDQRHGYVSRDIATYELAEAMAKAGCFPNAWYQNERGNIDNIAEDVRKYHDAGGDKMRPLEGVEYEPGDYVVNGDPAWPWIVERDYGALGVVIHERWDSDHREHVRDRSEIYRYRDDEDEDN